MSETADLTNRLLIEIPKRYGEIRVWRNNRVNALAVAPNGKRRYIKAGINGQADISGIIGGAGSGRRLEVEVKTGRDKQRKDQISFMHMIVRAGGCYIIARDVDRCLADLEPWAGLGNRAGKS